MQMTPITLKPCNTKGTMILEQLDIYTCLKALPEFSHHLGKSCGVQTKKMIPSINSNLSNLWNDLLGTGLNAMACT